MVNPAVEPALKHTPFHDIHVALGAKMVPFAGFEMPVQYPTGITAEHQAVRERCGLFDVSHMGEFSVTGPDAVAFVNYVTSNDVAALVEGQVQYSTILEDRGTIVDDCLVYRLADRVMLVVNASNRERDLTHVLRHVGRLDCAIADVSDETALLALQGPLAERVLQPLASVDLSPIAYYRFVEGRVAGVPAIISRTGYTGEDGFELYFAAADARAMWDALTAGGQVTPAGLGCRDTLRLEMGMALYGNDIDETTTPLEAGLGWVVKLGKGDFVGRSALVAQKERGLTRKLVGFTALERCVPRHGYAVLSGNDVVGHVCSGAMSPTLGVPIGTCYLPLPLAAAGTAVDLEIRGRRVPAQVTKMPFYHHGSHR